jgi:branched-chain amino acid transport system ATP-binding protein
VLSVADLQVSIQSVRILRGVSLEVPSGAVVGLVGRNGAGKTTLMKSIMGLLKPSGGAIGFDGIDLVRMPTHRRTRLGIGYMPEDRRLVSSLTVEENLMVPAWAIGLPQPQQRLAEVYRTIPELVALGGRKAPQLSGGQQKLVALGRALLCGTKLLLLDEPFEGVAPALAQRLAELVSELRARGLTAIVSASDLQHAQRIVDRIAVIDRGVILTSSPP